MSPELPKICREVKLATKCLRIRKVKGCRVYNYGIICYFVGYFSVRPIFKSISLWNYSITIHYNVKFKLLFDSFTIENRFVCWSIHQWNWSINDNPDKILILNSCPKRGITLQSFTSELKINSTNYYLVWMIENLKLIVWIRIFIIPK